MNTLMSGNMNTHQEVIEYAKFISAHEFPQLATRDEAANHHNQLKQRQGVYRVPPTPFPPPTNHQHQPPLALPQDYVVAFPVCVSGV